MCNIKIFSLGGLDEMGKNCYIVEIDNDIFVFDCGLKYANENLYGIDYIIPDFEYLVLLSFSLCCTRLNNAESSPVKIAG